MTQLLFTAAQPRDAVLTDPGPDERSEEGRAPGAVNTALDDTAAALVFPWPQGHGEGEVCCISVVHCECVRVGSRTHDAVCMSCAP